jgi:hypothetical protein
MRLSELREKGYKALVEALGVAGALEFLKDLEAGYGDYTADRSLWLDQLSIEDFQNDIRPKNPPDTPA